MAIYSLSERMTWYAFKSHGRDRGPRPLRRMFEPLDGVALAPDVSLIFFGCGKTWREARPKSPEREGTGRQQPQIAADPG
jgi:hypothetical protein